MRTEEDSQHPPVQTTRRMRQRSDILGDEAISDVFLRCSMNGSGLVPLTKQILPLVECVDPVDEHLAPVVERILVSVRDVAVIVPLETQERVLLLKLEDDARLAVLLGRTSAALNRTKLDEAVVRSRDLSREEGKRC